MAENDHKNSAQSLTACVKDKEEKISSLSKKLEPLLCQRNLWLEPASWRKISARKRAKNSEFSRNPAKKSLVGALRRPLESTEKIVEFFIGARGGI